VCTLWALGGDDCYLLTDPPLWLDRPIFSIYLICFLQFAADVACRTVLEPSYLWSFYFWLDFTATVSLLPEVIFFLADTSWSRSIYE
jgi:hypothetical protein